MAGNHLKSYPGLTVISEKLTLFRIFFFSLEWNSVELIARLKMTKLCCQKNVSTTYVLVRNREFVQLLKQLRTFHGTFMRGNSIGFSNLEVTHVCTYI